MLGIITGVIVGTFAAMETLMGERILVVFSIIVLLVVGTLDAMLLGLIGVLIGLWAGHCFFIFLLNL